MDDWEQLLPRRPWALGNSEEALAQFVGVSQHRAKAMLKSLVSRHRLAINGVPIMVGIATGVIWVVITAWLVDRVDKARWGGVLGVAVGLLNVAIMLVVSSVVAGILANLSLRRRVLRCLRQPECIACGYDLTGLALTQGQVVCPECAAPARILPASNTPPG